jgi:hypothetical protein
VRITNQQIAREAVRLLHSKMQFVGTIERHHDPVETDELGKFVADKQIKLLSKKSVELTIDQSDYEKDLLDFSDGVIVPAINVLALTIERDVMSMYKFVYNMVGSPFSPLTFTTILQGRKKLVDCLTPLNGRSCSLGAHATLETVDVLRGLFNNGMGPLRPEGFMGRTAGFDFYTNPYWPQHTVEHGNGDVFTSAGVHRVLDSGFKSMDLQQFVKVGREYLPRTGFDGMPMVADWALPVGNQHNISLAYNKDAFLFATANLPLSGDSCERATFDGISILLKDVDYNEATKRRTLAIEIIYGYRPQHLEHACRLVSQ